MHPARELYRFNALNYGADNRGVISASAAIQRAVDAAYAYSLTHDDMGATVFIPAGYYYITVGITLRSHVHILCEQGTMFNVAAAYAGSIWTNPAGNILSFASVTGGIYGTQTSTRTWTCIDLNASVAATSYVMFCTFSNMYIYNCNIGININVTATGWANGNIFENFTMWRPVKGVQTRTPAAGQLGNNAFNKLMIQTLNGTTTHGIDIEGAYNNFVQVILFDVTGAVVGALLNATTIKNIFTNCNFGDYNFITDSGTNNYFSQNLDDNRSLYLGVYQGTIVAATGITKEMINCGHIIFINAAAVDITANPQIVAGVDGQIIVITGRSDVNTLTLDDGTGLALSAQWVGGLWDSITLIYSSYSSIWIELCRSNN